MMVNHNTAVSLLLVLLSMSVTSADVPCEATRKKIKMTTKDNLFFTKTTPLVIGHRGNPMLYQENTLAGYKSLLDLNVDGFETDIFLTNDKQLVLFHDVNTTKLTGENRQITKMKYKEIKKLNIKKQLIYVDKDVIGEGGFAVVFTAKLPENGKQIVVKKLLATDNEAKKSLVKEARLLSKLQHPNVVEFKGDRVYNYTKTEKIPLLEDLLKMMKDSGLLMILEMKPSDPPYNLNHSRETGIQVAKMVKRLGLEKQVVLSSFDPFKLYYARKELNQLNTCFLVTKQYWDDRTFLTASKTSLAQLEGLKECLKAINDSNYGKFILETPTVVKAIGASSLDMDYDIYNNPKFSNDTYKMFKKHYGPEFSYGAWTVYKMNFNAKQLGDSEKKVQNLIDNGADRLYTDDIPRLLKKLGRSVRKNTACFIEYLPFPRMIITLLLVFGLII